MEEKSELELKFQKAFEIASSMQENLPPDIMLKFYAYYKQGLEEPSSQRNIAVNDLRNAFKLNAWTQISHISKEEAKIEYIKISRKIFKHKNYSLKYIKNTITIIVLELKVVAIS